MKKCTKCGESKSLEMFQRDASKPDGRKTRCKFCAQRSQQIRRAGTQPVQNTWPNLTAFDADQENNPILEAKRRAREEQQQMRDAKGPGFLERHAQDDDGEVYVGSFGAVARIRNVKVEQVEEKVSAVEEHRLKRKIRELESANKALVDDLSNLQLLGDVVNEARQNPVPGITPREVQSGLREGTALLMGSDWHIDETVEPGQVSGRNRFNAEIAARRMERFFESALWAVNSQRNIFKIRDLVLWLGGDLIGGFLHDDQVYTNTMSPPEALAFAQAAISDGIRYLLTDPELERIVIPCNDGNHGRMTKKMGSASRTMMSLEIMLYRMLAREFANEPRVQFIIAEGEHVYFDVYGRTIRFAHGDSIKYSGGIGGITIPVMKAVNAWNTLRYADLSCLGHFHQRYILPDVMVNGSLIGYGPFSMTIRARFEPPSQNFSILEAKRFRSIDLPLWVAEREDDAY